jgi:hypothetical protein
VITVVSAKAARQGQQLLAASGIPQLSRIAVAKYLQLEKLV